MTHQATTLEQRNQLKAAFRRLLLAAGGQAAATHSTRVSQQALSRYSLPQNVHDHAPLDVIADLTSDTGALDVINVLCQLAGGVFVPLPDPEPGALCWPQEIARAVREGGEATAVLCAALADDGRVSPQEIHKGNIIQELSEAIEALCRLRTHCEQVLDTGEGV